MITKCDGPARNLDQFDDLFRVSGVYLGELGLVGDVVTLICSFPRMNSRLCPSMTYL